MSIKSSFMHINPATLGPYLRGWASAAEKKPYLPILAALVAVMSLFSLQIQRGSVLYEGWVQDIFIHLNALLHIKEGNLPHTGFSTPIGSFYFLAFYLATYFGPASAYTAVYANGIVAALAMMLACLGGYRRVHPGWTSLLALYVGILAIAPRQLGQMIITFNASYNRWSWVFVAVLSLVISIPRLDADKTRAALLDGLLTGVILALLFFTKATYAVVGLGLVVASAFTVRKNSRPFVYGISALATLFVLIVSVQISLGIVFPYLDELLQAARVPGVGRVQQFMIIAYVTGPDVILIFMIAAASAIASRSMLHIRRALYLVALVLAGLALSTQNHLAFEVPLFPATALIALILFADRLPAFKAPAWLPAAATTAVLLLFLRPMAADTASIVEESFAPAEGGADVDWLNATPLRDLAFRPAKNNVIEPGNCLADPPEVVHDREFVAAWGDGVRLLNKHGARGSKVLSLSWTNPFPVLTGSPPVHHDLSWWDPDRTFSSTIHPRAETLFREVDYVLIPKYRIAHEPTTQMMLRIYGADIQRRYKLLEESGCWRLMGPVKRS